MSDMNEVEFAADYLITIRTAHKGNNYNQGKLRDLLNHNVECSGCAEEVKGKDARMKNGDLVCPKCKKMWLELAHEAVL